MHLLNPCLCVVCASVVLCGCVGSPPVKYYTLTARATAAEAPAPHMPIHVDNVRLPEYLDRSTVVVRRAPVVISFSDYQRWAAPLEAELRRIIAANLAARFGNPVEPDDASRLSVTVDQFEPTSDGMVELRVRWKLADRNGETIAAVARAQRYSAQADEETYEAAVAAMSIVLESFCEDVAKAYVGGG